MENQNNLPMEQDSQKKAGLVQKSKDFLDSAVSSLKGQDLNALVEQYTQEVTVVLEGMSEDLNTLQQQGQELSARLTILEENSRGKENQTDQAIKDLKKQVETLAKKNEDSKKKGTVTSVLTQVTWITGILAGAWVLTTLLKLWGG